MKLKRIEATLLSMVILFTAGACGSKKSEENDLAGKYEASVDITDMAITNIMGSYSGKVDYTFEGAVEMNYKLNLKGNKFEIVMDPKDCEESVKDFIEKNADGAMTASFNYGYNSAGDAEISSEEALNILGYTSVWDAVGVAREDYIKNYVEGITSSDKYDLEGKCHVKDGKIFLNYDNDELEGKIKGKNIIFEIDGMKFVFKPVK